MSALLRRLDTAITRPSDLPFKVVLTRSDARELHWLAELGEHALLDHVCEECGECIECHDEEPTRCGHGKPLCADCWPGFCSQCQAELATDSEWVDLR